MVNSMKRSIPEDEPMSMPKIVNSMERSMPLAPMSMPKLKSLPEPEDEPMTMPKLYSMERSML